MSSSFIPVAVVSFALGIAWQGIFEQGTTFVVFLLMLVVSSFMLAFKHKNLTILLVITLVMFTLGTLRVGLEQYNSKQILSSYAHLLNMQVELTGIVAEEPDIREYHINFIVELHDGVKILVKARPHQVFNYGDKVFIKGKLEKPHNFRGDTGREFDYVGYLAKSEVHYLVKYPKIEIIRHNSANKIKSMLFSIKGLYVDTINKLVPEPEAGLASGITVGAKRAMGAELSKAFRNTGLIHIVVLSGFNITIIIIFLLKVFAWLPKRVGYGLATLAVVLFIILTGADAPVVRAGIMGVLGVGAIMVRRKYAIKRALLIAVFIMLLWNPLVLLHDIAFQLSVVATMGLIYLSSIILSKLPFGSYNRELSQFKQVEGGVLPALVQSTREIVAVTIAAQIAVLPLLIYYMGEVSVVAVLVNVLALPVIPIAMLLTFIAGVVGMLSTTLALPFAYASYALLAYIIKLVEFFNSLPITTVQIF